MDIPLMKSRACLALAEETETARRSLFALLPRVPEGVFLAGNPETEDNPRGILCHVTFASFSYSCWIRRVLGHLDPGLEKEEKAAFLTRVRSLPRAADFEEASAWASTHYYETLAGVENDELEREFQSNWGATMAVELMMEHALVHLLRHRRQIEILLGDRPQPSVRNP
jgi:uncharacterized damage-inducible protein DinB